MKNSIYDICMSYTDKQEIIIDPFFKETPFLNNMPCFETSKGPFNVFEQIKSVDIPQVVDFDAPMPVLSTSTELGFASIGKIGGRIPMGLDQCKMMGKERVLAQKLGPILKAAGRAYDQTYLYNSVKKFCLDNKSDCVTRIATSGSGNAFYSMIGITWSEGENCGIFSPEMSGAKMFDVIPIGGGNVIDVPDGNGKVISGYVYEIASFLGIQLARKDRVHALVNIDDEHVPTYKQILDFILDFDGDGDGSVIYCHPRVYNMVANQFAKENNHADFIHFAPYADNAAPTMWFGNTPVIKDKNMFAGTEAFVEA